MVREGAVTYLVVICGGSTLTPTMLANKAVSLALPVTVKETCYGLLVEGERDPAEKFVNEIRKLNPNRIFVKLRGFPIGDPRICRANRGGGARIGFHQLEREFEVLPLISHALENLPAYMERKAVEGGKREGFSYEKLKKLVESMASS